MNLVDIVGRLNDGPGEGMCGPGDPEADRVAEFNLSDDKTEIVVVEMCDEYFAISLTMEEVDRLIAWLTAARSEMVEY